MDEKSPGNLDWYSTTSNRYYCEIAKSELSKENGNLEFDGMITKFHGPSTDSQIGLEIAPAFLTLADNIDLTTNDTRAPQYLTTLEEDIAVAIARAHPGSRIFKETWCSIDLTKGESDLKKGLRKSFKSLVNKQSCIHVATKCEAVETIEECKQLHEHIVGITTRTEKSWRLMARALEEESALLVVRKELEELTGYTYFFRNERNAYYGSAVTKDRKNAHPLMWRAILQLKSLGVENLIVDKIREGISHTDKEIAISKFKRGFGAQQVNAFYIVTAALDD